VHSVDLAELARELSKRATRRLRVLLQVNVASEPQQNG